MPRSSPTRFSCLLRLPMAQPILGLEAEALTRAQTAGEILPSKRFTFALLRDLPSRTGRADVVDIATLCLRAVSYYEMFQKSLRRGIAGPRTNTLLPIAIATDSQYAIPTLNAGESTENMR